MRCANAGANASRRRVERGGEAERHVTVLAALTWRMRIIMRALSLLRLQAADLRAAHAIGVEGPEDGLVVEIGGMSDESRGVLGAEHGWQGVRLLRQGRPSRRKGRLILN